MAYEREAAELLALIRQRRPVVHHLANFVTIADVAAATRAVGSLPIMAMAPEEIQEIVARADVLVVNLGTPTVGRLETITLAVREARERGLPIVIDPVGVGASRLRTEGAKKTLHAAGRAVVRANAAEAAALAGQPGNLRGVEAVGTADVAIVAAAVARLAGVAAITGPRDVITDGTQSLAVDNGHPWLRAVPGAGCMATALVGAFCAVAGPVGLVTAAASALACFGLAAERAAERAGGPGTLKSLLLDALFALEPDDLRAGMRCTELATTHASR